MDSEFLYETTYHTVHTYNGTTEESKLKEPHTISINTWDDTMNLNTIPINTWDCISTEPGKNVFSTSDTFKTESLKFKREMQLTHNQEYEYSS